MAQPETPRLSPAWQLTGRGARLILGTVVATVSPNAADDDCASYRYRVSMRGVPVAGGHSITWDRPDAMAAAEPIVRQLGDGGSARGGADG